MLFHPEGIERIQPRVATPRTDHLSAARTRPVRARDEACLTTKQYSVSYELSPLSGDPFPGQRMLSGVVPSASDTLSLKH
jgi:hypothetical protein